MKFKKLLLAVSSMLLSVIFLVGCESEKSKGPVVFYSNADDEVIEVIESVLKQHGYGDKYLFQSLGTSELGGKLLAEGKNIEADFITMASYYVDSAQAKHQMFLPLNFKVDSLEPMPNFMAPTTSQDGTIFVNTKLMEELGLPMPKSIRDLANPIYKGQISIADISSSSTAWLFIQALISAYGTGEQGKYMLTRIYQNAGAHIESSGSAPLKKVRAGEVAIGFGLRHQAVADKQKGLPIDYIDPEEGTFSLTEVIAVVDKGAKTNPLAMEMVKTVVENARPGLMKHLPGALYKGEVTDQTAAQNSKIFPKPLTVELLKEHVSFSEQCKAKAREYLGE